MKKLEADDMEVLMQELMKRMEVNKAAREKAAELSEEQQKIMTDVKDLRESTPVPSQDQLRSSTKNPLDLADVYGELPETDEEWIKDLPNWAGDLLQEA